MTAATVPQMPRFTGRLEPEHIALTNQLIEHWMGVGLSTERVDRDAAEQAVAAAYRAAGAEPVRQYSPLPTDQGAEPDYTSLAGC